MAQNWKSVLLKLYQEEQSSAFYDLRDSAIDSTHPLVQDMNLSWGEVQDAKHFLEWNELISKTETDHYEITKKGFNVAREHRIAQSEASLNFGLVGLTSILALSSASQLFVQTDIPIYQSSAFLGGLGALLIILLVIFLLISYRNSREFLVAR